MNSPIYEPINDVVEVETNMSYSRFNLETVEQTFGLNIIENLELFAKIPEVEISDRLHRFKITANLDFLPSSTINFN